MGLNIKRNKKGQFKMISGISDEVLHEEEWISEDEAKKILIERAKWDFVCKVIEIDMEFPNDYHVNGKHCMIENKHMAGKKFVLTNWNNDNVIEEKFQEICKRLNLNF